MIYWIAYLAFSYSITAPFFFYPPLREWAFNTKKMFRSEVNVNRAMSDLWLITGGLLVLWLFVSVIDFRSIFLEARDE